MVEETELGAFVVDVVVETGLEVVDGFVEVTDVETDFVVEEVLTGVVEGALVVVEVAFGVDVADEAPGKHWEYHSFDLAQW